MWITRINWMHSKSDKVTSSCVLDEPRWPRLTSHAPLWLDRMHPVSTLHNCDWLRTHRVSILHHCGWEKNALRSTRKRHESPSRGTVKWAFITCSTHSMHFRQRVRRWWQMILAGLGAQCFAGCQRNYPAQLLKTAGKKPQILLKQTINLN